MQIRNGRTAALLLATLFAVGSPWFAPAASAFDTASAMLEVTVTPAALSVGQTADLTVRAVMPDGSTITDYDSTVFVIVDNDNKAAVPYPEGYTFTAADQGKKTFSQGLSFSKAGNFEVMVADFDRPRIEGTAKVRVGKTAKTVDYTCVKTALETRETATMAAWEKKSRLFQETLAKRKSDLSAALSLTDTKAVKAGIRDAHTSFRNSVRQLRQDARESRKSAWATFETNAKLCKTPGATMLEPGVMKEDTK